MSPSWRASATGCEAGRSDPWVLGRDPWSSSGPDKKELVGVPAVFVPESAGAVIEQMAARIGRAFRLASKDLYRIESDLFDDVIADVAALLQRMSRIQL